MPLLPVAIYGLEVPAGGMPIQALPDFPATFRITMAAIDPSAEPQGDGPARATLKLIREPITNGEDDSDDEEDDSIDAIRARLGEIISDDESDSDDEKNGGPSDPAKSKKARTEAALKQILEAANEDEMDVDGGAKKNKGKGPAVEGESDEDSEEDDDDDDDEEMEMEEFVICTLDADKHYQQAIDITIGEDEQVYFQVTGAYDISLTGNYLAPDHTHDDDEDDDEEDEYDLSPDEDELEEEYSEEDDELDGLENPRIKELGSDDEDEEPPKLIEAKNDKGKKRSAESLDEMIKNAGEEKLSKKQQKKLKNNEGKAVGKEEAKDSPADKKKVQFAKNLEQGPTGSPLPKKEEEKSGKDQKTGLGVKQVQGITIDDKKLGTGPAAKKGDRVGMRYIGKLTNGKVFDSNKKGKPFSFKLGAGEVIKGWDVGVAGMTVGSERRITVPAHMAYGKSALPGIPANSTLVFDIKMVSLN